MKDCACGAYQMRYRMLNNLGLVLNMYVIQICYAIVRRQLYFSLKLHSDAKDSIRFEFLFVKNVVTENFRVGDKFKSNK